MWFTPEPLNRALGSQGGSWAPVSRHPRIKLQWLFPEPIREAEAKAELLF